MKTAGDEDIYSPRKVNRLQEDRPQPNLNLNALDANKDPI